MLYKRRTLLLLGMIISEWIEKNRQNEVFILCLCDVTKNVVITHRNTLVKGISGRDSRKLTKTNENKSVGKFLNVTKFSQNKP